ncbi:hypothetical protein HAX54_037235, partial [Datura stramonium]|nr:hypothetical protein [Datura stramonium]
RLGIRLFCPLQIGDHCSKQSPLESKSANNVVPNEVDYFSFSNQFVSKKFYLINGWWSWPYDIHPLLHEGPVDCYYMHMLPRMVEVMYDSLALVTYFDEDPSSLLHAQPVPSGLYNLCTKDPNPECGASS